ncbi:MAG: ABC transporter permease [Paracoccus sp. (in: a-proteobacteria)]|nr:ABC transporter permease [Paracoccus sp. (in: a-proteobacteria)]
MSDAAPARFPDASTLPGLSRTGLFFAILGLAGLALPMVQFRANRIVLGEGITMPGLLGVWGWLVTLLLAAGLIAAVSARRASLTRLLIGAGGALAVILLLGLMAQMLNPGATGAQRAAPASGFWLLALAFALMATDALTRLRPSLIGRWLMLAGVIAAGWLVLVSGWMDSVSVMREYAARQDVFTREALRHILLAFGSLGLALIMGLPIGIGIYLAPRLRRPVLGVLNLLQTIPSLALFGIMIPLFGWVAAVVPGAAALGVSGIGVFPALAALFLYSLLPVVSNTLVGLTGVSPAARDAAFGLGMTQAQVLAGVLLPLALPVIIAAIRIVLVQNIGLAVIAGLIGGGGFGTFVFQGLNQTAMDLVLLGALPTIAMALIAGIALDLIVEGLEHRNPDRRPQ